mgnify:CR=1 FL=1
MAEGFAPWCCPLCGAPLAGDNALKCPSGHSFDRAKEGYWHLLPVQNTRTKAPGDSKEMAARVKAVLRRTMGQTEEEEEKADDTLSFPGLTVSLSRYEVFYEGKKLEMPPKELEVLYFLASHVNQLFTRGQLLDQVWGFQVEVESRTVDVHVKRLRDKLVGCEKYGWRIQTIWGRGYKFEVIK